jgi:Sec-independent protein secretion pathway component TatC
VLSKHGINEQLVIEQVGEAFMVYIKISMISAAALASPWLLYQAWQFVAAGLYAHERKYITRYMPLSIILLISGMLFVYFLVLPWTLDFLIGFTVDIVPVQVDKAPTPELIERPGGTGIPVVEGNPRQAYDGMLWVDSKRNQLKLFLKGKVRVLSLRSDNLLAPEITLGDYIDMVVMMLLIFGLSFQLPLVVLTLERIGIVELDTLKSSRRYVYFILAIASAIITPGGDIVVMLMLTAPLCGLYELGIWLAQLGRKKELAT